MIQSLRLPSRALPSARQLIAVMAILGAALIAAGVVLPWFSVFAGLRPMSALGSTNGTALFVAAAVAATLALVNLVRGSTWARRALSVVGIGLVAFSAYLVVNLVDVYRQISADPLMVAQPGPGLAFVAVGALLILATSFVGNERSSGGDPGERP